jgi:hypothetical protein
MGVSSSVQVPAELTQNASAIIAFNKTCFLPGEEVQGYVQFNVTGPFSVGSVFIRPLGQANTAVTYSTGSGKNRRTHTAHDEDQFFGTLLQIANFPSGAASPGQYQFPFNFAIPLAAHASTEVYRASIRYDVSVLVSGVNNAPTQHVVSRANFFVIPVVNSIEPKETTNNTAPVKCCCCFDKGQIISEMKPDSVAYRTPCTATILLGIVNQSEYNVRGVELSLFQTVTRRAQGYYDNGCHSFGLVVLVAGAGPGEGFGSFTSPPTDLHGFQWPLPAIPQATVQSSLISVRRPSPVCACT